MKLVSEPGFLKIFFGICACSWMPHWACHYYRLETHSSFVVGSWSFSFADSVVSLFVYTIVIVLNLVAIQFDKWRFFAAALTAIGHLAIGSLHIYRLVYPFTFEVFGYSWSYAASLREALIVMPVGLVSLGVAIYALTKRTA
jgi:hypothetical protein